MRIILTGAGGQVGRELKRLLPSQGELIPLGRQDLDLGDPQSLQAAIRNLAPDLVVNAAAYTAVDRAETEPAMAALVNTQAPLILAQECQRQGAGLIHISTDYVFDGSQGRPYQESDSPAPLGVYGHSKWEGEKAIQAHCDHYCILRTAWVYGTLGRSNFVKTMLKLGRERSRVQVVWDQIGAPTWSRDLAVSIRDFIPYFHPGRSGIYHFTNSGVASWYDFAVAIFAEARRLGIPLALEEVVPIPTTDYPTAAKRPAYSVLDWGKLAQVLGNYPPPWRTSLRLMLEELSTREDDLS